jgi:hypothetical protein
MKEVFFTNIIGANNSNNKELLSAGILSPTLL